MPPDTDASPVIPMLYHEYGALRPSHRLDYIVSYAEFKAHAAQLDAVMPQWNPDWFRGKDAKPPVPFSQWNPWDCGVVNKDTNVCFIDHGTLGGIGWNFINDYLERSNPKLFPVGGIIRELMAKKAATPADLDF